jgi:hypothetical protein
MLKIGTVKWQGKCSSHPNYDPSATDAGEFHGSCARCHDLFLINSHHQQSLRLMRTFSPPRRRPTPADFMKERQQSLFSSL